MIRSLQIAALTNTGLYRKRNEDSLLVADQVMAQISMNTPRTFFIDSFPVILAVADGIGGSIAGDRASREVLQYLANAPCPDSEEKLRDRILSSGTHLDHLVKRDPALEGMGTTLAGILCTDTSVFIFSCGDSRVYVSPPDRGSIRPLTRDHSVIQEMIEEGTLTEKEARTNPLGHIITSCLSGGRNHHPPDVRISKAETQQGTRFILCTDGVWDYGGKEFLCAVCSGSPKSAAQRVHDICYKAGAPDNITLIIADIST